jgi:hypothetical protein
VFGNVALDKNCRDLRIEPNSKQNCSQLQRLLAEHSWSIGDCESMKVDDAVKNVVCVLS